MSKNKNREIEFVFTEINPDKIEKKLIEIGAKKQFDEIFESTVFDYPDYRLNYNSAWVRLRKEGDRTMLAYKKRLGVESKKDSNNYPIHTGTEEIEFEVSSYEKVIEYQLAIGLIIKHQQEKRRIRYEKNGVFFDIDFWPYLSPILEIESDSVEKIDKAILELGLKIEDKRSINIFFLYREAGMDVLDYQKITFSELIKKDKNNTDNK